MCKSYSLWSVVIATLVAGCSVEAPDDVAASAQDVLAGPHACFVDQGQPNPSVPLSRRFNASCSTPSTGSFIWKYSWDFGDGSGLLTGNTVTDHVFPFTNTCYKVQLTVLDINGTTDTTSHYATFCTVGPCNPICPP